MCNFYVKAKSDNKIKLGGTLSTFYKKAFMFGMEEHLSFSQISRFITHIFLPHYNSENVFKSRSDGDNSYKG